MAQLHDAVREFMWGYQRHFRLTMTISAERLFQLIDPSFAPGVFLVGVRIGGDGGDDAPGLCVEPEKDFWLTSRDLAAVWPAELPGPGKLVSEKTSDAVRVREWRRTLRAGLEKLLCNSTAAPRSRRYFAALPVEVGDYWVTGVLALEKPALQRYQFTEEQWSTDSDLARLPDSLLEVVIGTFLMRLEAELGMPEPFGNILPGGELLRTAAGLLTDSLVFEATGQYGAAGLYEKCVRISSAFYEHTEAAGNLVIAEAGDALLNYEIHFAEPPLLGDIRKARKLLQTANDFDLVGDGVKLYGLVRPARSKSRLKISFTGHHQWQLSRGGQVLLEVKYDEPGLPHPPYDVSDLQGTLQRIFPKLAPSQCDNLLRLIEGVSRARHGAMLVITEQAAREAKRLRFQAISIRRKKLTPALLVNLSSIDGAVLVNPRGFAFAMGAILDGRATANGNAARGARFNSAIRYQEFLRDEYNAASFIVVVSDDGDTSFLPPIDSPMPARPLGGLEPLYEEIAELTHYGKSIFARRDSEMIKMLFEPLHRFDSPQDECPEEDGDADPASGV